MCVSAAFIFICPGGIRARAAGDLEGITRQLRLTTAVHRIFNAPDQQKLLTLGANYTSRGAFSHKKPSKAMMQHWQVNNHEHPALTASVSLKRIWYILPQKVQRWYFPTTVLRSKCELVQQITPVSCLVDWSKTFALQSFPWRWATFKPFHCDRCNGLIESQYEWVANNNHGFGHYSAHAA